MTLRGELDSFPLETVVQLVHSTNKTGQLEIRDGDATGGTLGFDGGRLVAAIAGEDQGELALGSIFAVGMGTFEFIPWNEPPAPNLAGDLDQLLDRAVEERDRIVAVRKIIPDDRSRFRLSERAAEKGNITLAPDQWRTLLAVNGERDLPGVAGHLKMGKLATRAALAALVEAGFIDVLDVAEADPARVPAAVPPTVAIVEPAPAPEAPAAEPPSPEAPQWSPPVREWAAPAPEPSLAPEPLPVQSWEPQAAQSWEAPAPVRQPDEWERPQSDLRADLAAALDARMSAPVPEPVAQSWEPEAPPAPPVDSAPAPEVSPAQDERLAALSGVFSPSPSAPADTAAPGTDRISEWSRPAPTIDEEETVAPVEEKKKGRFGFLKREEAAPTASSTVLAPAAAGGIGRAGMLAELSNALLAEYNGGHYGKGRLDDRMANLLMRVDEQADPIDRPLPIVDDRIDAQALDRENMPEQQAVPYLAILVSQIYEDAERTFGKDKAKKGYRAAQQQVFGADASMLAASDIAGRLPRV